MFDRLGILQANVYCIDMFQMTDILHGYESVYAGTSAL